MSCILMKCVIGGAGIITLSKTLAGLFLHLDIFCLRLSIDLTPKRLKIFSQKFLDISFCHIEWSMSEYM